VGAEDTASVDESLPLKSAINAWTSGAAWASFDDHRKGVIKPGMLADLVVLSADIFDPKKRALPSTEVNITIFDGKVVYRRNVS
jgi:predicted amidohydrolase YtcJ